MVLVSGFALDSAVELEDGTDANLPDSPGDCGLLGADGEFALVFVGAEFALDGHMRAFGEGWQNRPVSRRRHIDATRCEIPRLRRHSSRTSWCQREDRDVGCVADLLFGVAADETDEGDSIEVHTFLLFYPFVSGRKRVGAAAQTRSCFSGGTGNGEPEPERCRRQSRSFAGAGRRKSSEAVPRQRAR